MMIPGGYPGLCVRVLGIKTIYGYSEALSRHCRGAVEALTVALPRSRAQPLNLNVIYRLGSDWILAVYKARSTVSRTQAIEHHKFFTHHTLRFLTLCT